MQRLMSNSVTYHAEAPVDLGGGLILPPGRYVGWVEWTEVRAHSGTGNTGKRFKLELPAEDIVAYGGKVQRDLISLTLDVGPQVADGSLSV